MTPSRLARPKLTAREFARWWFEHGESRCKNQQEREEFLAQIVGERDRAWQFPSEATPTTPLPGAGMCAECGGSGFVVRYTAVGGHGKGLKEVCRACNGNGIAYDNPAPSSGIEALQGSPAATVAEDAKKSFACGHGFNQCGNCDKCTPARSGVTEDAEESPTPAREVCAAWCGDKLAGPTVPMGVSYWPERTDDGALRAYCDPKCGKARRPTCRPEGVTR